MSFSTAAMLARLLKGDFLIFLAVTKVVSLLYEFICSPKTHYTHQKGIS